MNAIPAPTSRLRTATRRRALTLTVPRVAALLLALVVASVLLRTTALHARYWIDEGLSVGIASHPLADIPGLLRQDGSPPLYYLLLHLWTSLFGVGEARTHLLSAIFAVATVPVGYLFGRLIFGVRAGIAAAVLFALNPFLTFYAQETRMYALIALLSLCVAGTFTLAFALGRRAWRWPFAASLILALYTHNWALFLGAGAILTLAVLWWSREDPAQRRALVRDALAPFGVVALAYLPWVPTLIFQARHTAAPWSHRPGVSDIWNTLAGILNGPAPAMAFALASAVGLVALLTRRDGPRRRPLRGLGPDGQAALALLTLLVAGVLLAWLASQPNPAWTVRYLSAFLGPFLLVGAAGLARAGWLGVVGLVLLAVFWGHPRTTALNTKSDAHRAAVDVRDRLYPGDLVVAAHPEYGPTMHLYLPAGLRWASTLGPVKDPTIMDWRDALERLQAARPKATSDAMVRSLRQGQRLVLVMPLLRSARWNAPWTRLVRTRAIQWERRLDRDTRLVRTLAVPRLRGLPLPRGVRIVLYERVPDGTGGLHAATRPEPR